VACPQGGRPAAVFFPLKYPFPYGPGKDQFVGLNSMFRGTMLNKVDTKPQAQSKFDVTSFQRKQISQKFMVGTAEFP
jgi:hypothetical protein